MKNIFVALIILIGVSKNVFSQGLTNGEVFNYSIGDVMQSDYRSNGTLIELQTLSVLTKTNSVALDTFFYEIQQHVFHPALNVGQIDWHSLDTVNVVITNLNAVVVLNNTSYACFDSILDTTYMNSCNRIVWESRAIDASNLVCLDIVRNVEWYIQGLGGPYYTNYSTEPLAMNLTHELTYFRKGVEVCGSYYSSVGLKDQQVNILEIFPNPCFETIGFSKMGGDFNLRYITIFDQMGQIVKEQVVENSNDLLDVSLLTPGLYTVNAYNENGELILNQRLVKL
jgi:hypothetical protein